MNRYHDLHFNRDIITIYPGEFCTTPGPELISTVLGSCVSIALFDAKNCIGGMNHFMLAKDTKENNSRAENEMQRRFIEQTLHNHSIYLPCTLFIPLFSISLVIPLRKAH